MRFNEDGSVKHYKSLVNLANEKINIVEIYNAMGHAAPQGMYGSFKIHCPFNYEHGDGGLDKNCRIYPPSHIYCFAMHGLLKPVYLYAKWKDLQYTRAAVILLEERGLLKSSNYKDRWEELLNERAKSNTNSLGDQADVIAALQTEIAQDERYMAVEFADPVREAWKLILRALDVLWSRPESDITAIYRWYDNSLKKLKEAVSNALKGEHYAP